MDTRPTILNVPFNGLTKRKALDTLMGFLQSNKNHLVVTPNPEAVMIAQRNANFLRILQSADLVLADGTGIRLVAKFKNLPIPSRVPGCDITEAFLIAAKGHTCYLLGAAPGVADTARRNLKQQGVNVIGARDGYFNTEEEKLVIAEIQELTPDILIIGMGMPRQEEWAATNLHKLPSKVTLCVGGTIDIIAENARRAPKILRRCGLEWLYRLFKNPSRARRMLDIPRFIWAALSS